MLCFATRPTSRHKGRRDGHAAAHCPSGDHPCWASWFPWCYSAGERCSLTDEEPQVICESPTAPCSGATIWVILCLMLTPPAHPSGEDSLEHKPDTPATLQSHIFAEKTKECRISYIKGWRWAVEEGERCLPIISCLGESASRQSQRSGSGSGSCVVE